MVARPLRWVSPIRVPEHLLRRVQEPATRAHTALDELEPPFLVRVMRTFRTLRQLLCQTTPRLSSRWTHRLPPRLEALEPRGVPAIITFTGAVNSSWHTAGNWDLARVPAAGDDVVSGRNAEDLRHLFATTLTNTDVPEGYVRYLMGHAPGKAALVAYTHLDQLRRRYSAALETEWASLLDAINQRAGVLLRDAGR